MRPLGGKFHIANNEIVKSSNGDAIPHSEPVFLLRARDYLAVPTLIHLLAMCEKDGCTDYQLNGMREEIKRFQQWAIDNPDKMKQPGITRGL